MRDSRCYNQDICGTITPQTKKRRKTLKGEIKIVKFSRKNSDCGALS